MFVVAPSAAAYAYPCACVNMKCTRAEICLLSWLAIHTMATASAGAGGVKEKATVSGEGRTSFVEGWEFMQTLGEGAYGE